METTSQPISLQDLLAVLRRRRAVLLTTLLVALLVAVGITVATEPVYSATSSVRIGEQVQPSVGDVGGTIDLGNAERRINTEAEVIRSPEFEAAVLEVAGVAESQVENVSVVPVADAEIVRISVQSPEPSDAALLADAYANVYVDQRIQETVDAYTALSEQLAEEIDQLETELQTVDEQLAAAPEGATRSVLEVQQQALVRDLGLLQSQIIETRLAAGAPQSATSVVGRATTPSDPVAPNPVQNVGIAAVLGLIVGVGLAFALEQFDDRLRSVEDGQALTLPRPTMAVIPRLSSPDDPLASPGRGEGDTAAAEREAFRSLRTSLRFVDGVAGAHTVLVTSPLPKDGKTSITLGLAASAARAGERVVVLDCDFRRPRLTELLHGDPSGPGLSTLLAGERPLGEVIFEPVEGLPGSVHLLPPGPPTADPTFLLSDDRLGRVLEALDDKADLVLIDVAPVLPVADALLLAPIVDSVLMVVNIGQTRRSHLRTSLERITRGDADNVGIVFNGVSGDQYSYAYRYHDRSREQDRPVSRFRSRGSAPAE